MSKQNNKNFTTAEVPREEHSEIRKLAFDSELDVRDVYSKIIPLGLKAYKEQLKTQKQVNN